MAAAVVTLGAVAVPVSANAAVSLSSKTPEQVLAMIGDSTTDAFSGTVKTTSDLGLPSLPAVSGGSSGTDSDISSVLTLLSSAQTARVYVDGPTKVRLQVIKQMAEQDVIRNGKDVWVYDSKKSTAVHTTLPSRRSATPAPTPTASTPAEVARAIVARLDSSTKLSVGTDSSVANRSAYTLVLKPKASGTLVSSVTIAVDAKTGLPLEVSAKARGQKDAAFSIGFSNLVIGKPAERTFEFTPPKSAKVTEKKAPTHSARPDSKNHGGTKTPAGVKPTVVGSGWSAVIVSPKESPLSSLGSVKQFSQLTTAVDGGRVFHTSLLNVLVTDDGRVLAGSVPISRLLAVAAAPSPTT
ncbi:LolA family protein [Lacisediminihabitans changchengi]|uniref:Outer membrane lipoprotein carrier protein LolA n=1 Tax=Lacisediminihabitans changchengi TaxID=2787634 RepID=A0A934SPK9_9MICO|nr:outer-membrane lipoprotein carrier protein LolA [Lacisediminihabitans changchengi]MBK4349119.1 outer membrane lipoprotein carrier protein LolA [Lacisediminihabitans changchengi]